MYVQARGEGVVCSGERRGSGMFRQEEREWYVQARGEGVVCSGERRGSGNIPIPLLLPEHTTCSPLA